MPTQDQGNYGRRSRRGASYHRGMQRTEDAGWRIGRASVDLVLGVDPARREPLHRQLYDGLRAAILEQRLKPGARLPSTRALASTLGLARNTVHGAYDQLLAEGYLETRHGSGTYVAASLPDDALRAVAGSLPKAASARVVSRSAAPSG